jgi:hypothetical protein
MYIITWIVWLTILLFSICIVSPNMWVWRYQREVIRIRISKNRQHNGQKKKYKRTNSIKHKHKTKDGVTRTDYVLEGLTVITCGMDYQWLRVGGIISDYVREGLSVIVCVFIIFNCSCTDLRKYSNLLKRQNICFVRGVCVKREAIYI